MNATALTCVTEDWMFIWAEMIVACFALPINFFLTVSLIVFRQKLRTQLVNIYAANLVVAVFFNAVIRVSDTTWSLFGMVGGLAVYPYNMEATYGLELLWLYHKSLVVTMYVVITGGIAFVIMALRENLFRVHRTVAGVSHDEEFKGSEKKRNRLNAWFSRNRKHQALIFIAISWVVPILCSMIAISIDKICLTKCTCIFNYIPSDRTIPACGNTCSLVWPPLPNSSLLAGCFCWFVFVIILLFLLTKSNIDFNRVSKQIMSTNIPPIDNRADGIGIPGSFPQEISEGEGVEMPDKYRLEIGNNANVENETREYAEQRDDQETTGSEQRSDVEENDIHTERNKSWKIKRWIMFRHSTKHSSLLLRKLSKHLNKLLVISIVYIIGTGVLVSFVTYSILAHDELIFHRNEQHMVIILMMPAAAECFTAVALCMELPNLRSAVHSMMEVVLYILSFGCLRK